MEAAALRTSGAAGAMRTQLHGGLLGENALN